MRTVSLKISAREMCAPNTINRFLTSIRGNEDLPNLFWPRLVRDRSINCGKRICVKMSEENLKFLRDLKSEIRERYGLFVPYSLLVCVLVRLSRKAKERKVMSLNVHGYRAPSNDFKARLCGIAGEIEKVLPDIIMLQEFRVGEKRIFLKVLMKRLKHFYNFIYPKAYKAKEHFNNCICLMLVGKNITSGSRKLNFACETKEFALRYNFVQLDKDIYLNVWIQQIFDAQQERKEIAEQMWDEILRSAQEYSLKRNRFILAGDFNSYMNGPFEDNLIRLRSMLTETKTLDAANCPTGQANILDYVFVNRYTLQYEVVNTVLFSPSMTRLELSDHEALITTITENI